MVRYSKQKLFDKTIVHSTTVFKYSFLTTKVVCRKSQGCSTANDMGWWAGSFFHPKPPTFNFYDPSSPRQLILCSFK